MTESMSMPGVVMVIQARMNARRLPGKVLLPLGGATVLEQVIRRVRAANVDGPIVVAIPEGEDDNGIRNICALESIPCYSGSENDVLDRVLQAAEGFDAQIIVRCQASNPLLDPRMLWASARYAVDSGMDLVTVARLPVGVACEAFPVRTLERIAEQTDEPFFREQVTSYSCLRPDLFERAHLPPPPRYSRPDLRLTLETEADYWFLKRLYAEIAPGPDGLILLDDVIAHIDAAPELRRHSPDGYAVVQAA